MDILDVLRPAEIELRRHSGIAWITPISVPAGLEPHLDASTHTRNHAWRRRSRDQTDCTAGIPIPTRHIIGGQRAAAAATKECTDRGGEPDLINPNLHNVDLGAKLFRRY